VTTAVIAGVHPADLTGLAAAVRAVRAVDPRELSPGARHERLVALRAQIDGLEIAFTDTLAASDVAGDGESLHGARSTTSWVRDQLRLAPGDANERVRLARAVGTGAAPLATAAQQVADGRLTFDQLRVIGRAVRDVGPDLAVQAATLLTDLAPTLDAAQLRLAGRHLRYVLDPDGAAAGHEQLVERRRASFAPLLDGMHRLEVLADPEGAALIDAVLAAGSAPISADDPRTADQRRYDALLGLLRTAAEHGLAGPRGAPGALRPQVLVACTPEALAGSPTAPPPLLADGTPVPQHVLDRLACDAAITRIVFGPAGQVLDLGRTQRLFTPAQRLALWARDQGCRFPGCRSPWVQAHHVVPWQDGGATNLANGLSLCGHDHQGVHEGRWRITIDDAALGANGPVTFWGPDGVGRTSHPPGLPWLLRGPPR
jgi:hypothetical protein